MSKNKRKFSLSIWDHKDNFICILKSANSDFDGQSFNENFTENVNGEKTLSFSVPMYIFLYDSEQDKYLFQQNEAWKQIYNEQKIRYIEYDLINSEPIRIEEFVLKEYTETRNEEQKIAECTCESLAVYELGKVGWNIDFDSETYITSYEQTGYHEELINNTLVQVKNCPDLLTLDYWMRKILYTETNLGKVSNTTECTYLLQGLQLRDDEGYPIDKVYSINNDGEYEAIRIEEPKCNSVNSSTYIKYYNPTGWSWRVEAKFENDPEKQSVSTLYESPVINQFNQVSNNRYVAQSYQKRIGQSDNTKILRPHPIPDEELDTWTYVTDIKRRLLTSKRSNVYSIIQDLCESFEVWSEFKYTYSNDGKIINREIIFKTESINEEIKFDFAYGKNLKSCSRKSNSNDLITKLYVTSIDSELVEGNLLSIQEATANPTKESYLYNFDYFYKCGMLSKIKDYEDKNLDITESDEYIIDSHYGIIRELNNRISKLQKYLVPLYARKNDLESELTVQEGTEIGYKDNIQSIAEKIEAIPKNQQIIKSWSEYPTQDNHIGTLKTFSITTDLQGHEYYYLNFGRDDILVKNFNFFEYSTSTGEKILSSSTTLSGFIPRIYKADNIWNKENPAIEENSTSENALFTRLNNGSNYIYNYSELGDKNFISGIKISMSAIKLNYGRFRYKYAPLAYYYLLIKDYWDKIKKVEENIKITKSNLIDINNKILAYELQLKRHLKDKKEYILQFEKKYKTFIREGYWEPSNYKSQKNGLILFTGDNNNSFDGLEVKDLKLNELKLNNELYTHYFELPNFNINQIDIDSIELKTKLSINNIEAVVPWYRGNGFELFLSNDGTHLLIGATPTLIDKYKTASNNFEDPADKYFTIIYKTTNNGIIEEHTEQYEWLSVDDNIQIRNYSIYISKDNIVTNDLKVYGGNSTNSENELVVYEDYSYQYESSAYEVDGNNIARRIDPSKQTEYNKNLYYIYGLKIDLKLTNNVINYFPNSGNNLPNFTVTYAEETTLQYLYNDAVSTGKKYSIPQVDYNISVIDLSSLNGYENYKPKLGQKVPINDIEMGLNNFEGFITSISYPLEEKYNTNITIATYNNKFEDVFKKLTATVSNISYNQNSIYNAANAFEVDGNLKTSIFKNALENNFNRIRLGTNNDITIDKETGITLRDIDTGSGVKLIGNGIFLTDNINKDPDSILWKSGITGEGINADAIIGGSIDTKQISIWNASENQLRFIWNDQGLVAYADKQYYVNSNNTPTSTNDKQLLIDYDKYIKFNQNGLEFDDHGKSALSLGWEGLKIQTQNRELELDADKGLILKQNAVTRLQLGKLDNGTLYGLRLIGTNGDITFQNDNQGDLWLHRYIRLGGSISSTNTVQNPTAGIYGLSTSVPLEMQMGLRRNDEGTVIWDSSPIRFWAGPQTKDSYTTNTHITQQDINNSSVSTTIKNNFVDNENLIDGSPTLAKFKVSANGDIIASGIDVGGWIGEGSKLHSSDNEAILRSGTYGNEGNNPVVAIGKPNTDADIISGTNYNFRIYKDGSIKITSSSTNKNNKIIYNTGILSATSPTSIVFYTGTTSKIEDSEFKVYANGTVTASALSIGQSQVEGLEKSLNDLSDLIIEAGRIGIIGGYYNSDSGLTTSGTTSSNKYYVGMLAPSTSNDIVYYASSNSDITKSEFKVLANGTVYAKNINISGGGISGLSINSNKLSYVQGENTTYIQCGSYDSSIAFAAGSTSAPQFKVTNAGKLTANNADITGVIKATSGKIGGENGITIGTGKIYSENHSGITSETTGFYLGTNGISLGNNVFKVTSAGKLTATDATITGAIRATSGEIGGDNGIIIGTGKIYSLSHKVINNPTEGFYLGTDGLSIGNGFKVTNAGKLTATGATITGIIKATSGKIGGDDGITIGTGKIYSSSHSSLDNIADGFYLGTEGLSIGNGFKVTRDGVLTATGVDITGTIKATSGTIGNFTIGNAMRSGYKTDNYNTGLSVGGVYIGTDGISLGALSSQGGFAVDSKGTVTANDIFFNGKITTRYDNVDYTGINTDIATVPLNNKNYTFRVINGLIVGGYSS